MNSLAFIFGASCAIMGWSIQRLGSGAFKGGYRSQLIVFIVGIVAVIVATWSGLKL